MNRALLALLGASCIVATTFASTCEVKVSTQNTNSEITTSDGYTKTTHNLYGTMNGPIPVPITDPTYADFVYTNAMTATYAKSFKDLGEATGWVRFNDLGVDQLLSITQIFSAWPLSDTALAAADVDALANNLDNYDFSGIDKYVAPAVDAGRNLDWRIGDGWTTSNALQKGEADDSIIGWMKAGESFPAAWKFPTNYETAQGLKMYAAVAATLADHVHSLYVKHRKSTSQKLFFDVLTETADAEECVFWPGTGQQYAALFGAVVPAVKAKLGLATTSSIKFVAANSAFGKSFGSAAQKAAGSWVGTAKRVFFQDFLKACESLGYAGCPADVIAFHPFNVEVADYTEMMKFAYNSVQDLMPTFSPRPSFALTAWAQHGSGMYDTNDSVEGANLMADILLAFQDYPLEFTIYYKFDGWNDQKPQGPALALLNGDLKPNAMPFVMMSDLAAVSSSRVVGSCSGGDSIIAVGNDKLMSAVITGAASNTANIQVTGWSCVGQTSTLAVESVTSATDSACNAISQNSLTNKPDTGICYSGSIASTKVSGSVHKNGLFYAKGSSSAYTLPFSDGAYVARITLSCGSSVPTTALVSVDSDTASMESSPSTTSYLMGSMMGVAALGLALFAFKKATSNQQENAYGPVNVQRVDSYVV